MNKFLIAILLTLFITEGCAPTRFVQPLEKKQNAVNAHVGGPVINLFGVKMPIPFTSLTYGRGITDELTAFGSLHTTSLAFGVVQAEAGIVKEVLSPDSTQRYIPGISISPVLNTAFDVWQGNFKLWPEIDINAYWKYSRRKDHFFYAGVANWFELSSLKAHGERQASRWIFNPQIGHRFVNSKWDYTLEFKYLAPTKSNQYLAVDYVKPFGEKGALGFYFGITRKF